MLQLRDVQVGDGLVLGTPVVPNLWGAEVVLGSFGGVRASDRLVSNLLTLKSSRKPLAPYLSRTLLVCPTCTLAHPSTNTKLRYLPPNNHALNPYSASSPSTCLSMLSFRAYLFHPAVCA